MGTTHFSNLSVESDAAVGGDLSVSLIFKLTTL